MKLNAAVITLLNFIPFPATAEGHRHGIADSVKVETVNVFTASDTTDHYANGVVLTAFKDHLYCMWQSSPKDEDSDDTRVVYSRSSDEGRTWSNPTTLAHPTEDYYCTSGGWIVNSDTLLALIDTWEKGLEPRGGKTYYAISTNGQDWGELMPVMMANGTQMEGVLEQDPHRLADGRLIGACHFQPGLHVCPVYTDDPTGRSGWKRGTFESEDRGKQSRELEPSLFVKPDGTIVMLFRDQSSSFRKLASTSNDYGESWTKPVVTEWPDARTKQCAGNLPDGRPFMVSCPSSNKHRWPLVLQISNDGETFSQTIELRSGEEQDLPPRRYEGKAKTLGYNYPKAMTYKNRLYVGYSVNKEDVECTIIDFNNK